MFQVVPTFLNTLDQKMSHLVGLLDASKNTRQVVLCSDESAARSIEGRLNSEFPSSHVFVLCESREGSVKESSEKVRVWEKTVRKGRKAVFVLSDLYFLETSLQLTADDLCIHFDLPMGSLSKFKTRQDKQFTVYEKCVN